MAVIAKKTNKEKENYRKSEHPPFPRVAVTAADMADNLGKAATILLDGRLLDDEGYSNLTQQISGMKKLKSSLSWKYLVDPDRPISFLAAEDKNGNQVFPSLSCNIVVDQNRTGRLPFEVLDVALLVVDKDKESISRWHVDHANHTCSPSGFQDGPLTHLQYGGHVRHGNRQDDHPLKVPRWLFPPLDLILLCEVVAANFFPKIWEESLQQDRTWNEVVSISQKLCYAAFFNKLHSTLAVSNRSLLQHMSASAWGAGAEA